MKTWIKRSLFALASAGIVLGSLTACGHRMHHGGWRADATPEQSAEWRGRMVERVAGKLARHRGGARKDRSRTLRLGAHRRLDAAGQRGQQQRPPRGRGEPVVVE